MRWSIVTVLAFASTLVARPTPPNQFRDTYNHTELNRQLNNRSFGRDSQTKVSFFLPTTSLNGIKGHFKQNNPFVPVEMGKQTQSNVQSFMEGIAQDKLKVSPESVKLTQSKIVYKDKEGKRIAFLVQIPDSPNKVCGPKNICIGVISDGVLINPSKQNGIIWSTSGIVNDLRLVKALLSSLLSTDSKKKCISGMEEYMAFW